MSQGTDLLVKYAEYHRDRRNIATHFVGVPMIVFAVGVLLSHPRLTLGGWTLTPAWIAFAAAVGWYMTRGLLTLGLLVSVAMGMLLAVADQVGVGLGSWVTVGIAVFVIGWTLQFIGHYYEGRKPAFVDDLAQLLVGPMFVTAEALFSFGWNPRLLAEIERRAGPTRLRDLAHPA